jgi:hypothetical protein
MKKRSAAAAALDDEEKEENVYTGPDRLSNTVDAVMRQHVAPFLISSTQRRVLAADGRAVSEVVRRDTPLVLVNRTLRDMLPQDTQLVVRTKQFRDLLTWMQRWCEIRKDLLIDADEEEKEPMADGADDEDEDDYEQRLEERRTKTVGVEVLKEMARLPALGLPVLVFPGKSRRFLSDPIQIEAREAAWRSFLIGKTPQEYDAATNRFRTTMNAIALLKLAPDCGWTGGKLIHGAKFMGSEVSAFEAVLQLVLGRNLVSGEDYFSCMMWSLLEEFGAHAAWVVASLLVWLGHYSDLVRFKRSTPREFAHVARVMLGKDPRSVLDLKQAQTELSLMRYPFDEEPRNTFGSYQYRIWVTVQYIWLVHGIPVDALPE